MSTIEPDSRLVLAIREAIDAELIKLGIEPKDTPVKATNERFGDFDA